MAILLRSSLRINEFAREHTTWTIFAGGSILVFGMSANAQPLTKVQMQNESPTNHGHPAFPVSFTTTHCILMVF